MPTFVSVSSSKLSPRTNFIDHRARTFKWLWGPGIDSKKWIPPAYVAWRAGTITLFLLGSPHILFKNSSSAFHSVPIRHSAVWFQQEVRAEGRLSSSKSGQISVGGRQRPRNQVCPTVEQLWLSCRYEVGLGTKHRGIKYCEAQARLLFDSHETSPIIWIGKPAHAIQCKLRVGRWQVGPKHCRGDLRKKG